MEGHRLAWWPGGSGQSVQLGVGELGVGECSGIQPPESLAPLPGMLV